MDLNNQQLIKDFNNGDVKAFEIIYKSFFDPLKTYATTIIEDESVATDLVQELFTLMVLLTKVFHWGREVNPSKPLTAGVLYKEKPIQLLHGTIQPATMALNHSYGFMIYSEPMVHLINKKK